MIKFQFEIKRIDSYNLEEFHYDTGKYHHEAGKIKPQSRKNQATKQGRILSREEAPDGNQQAAQQRCDGSPITSGNEKWRPKAGIFHLTRGMGLWRILS